MKNDKAQSSKSSGFIWHLDFDIWNLYLGSLKEFVQRAMKSKPKRGLWFLLFTCVVKCRTLLWDNPFGKEQQIEEGGGLDE